METYYAHIENNTVISIEVVTDEFFNANPERYSGLWLKVGNGSNRPYCGKGYIYLLEKDKIIPSNPYPSWTLDVNDEWQAPVPMPNDGNRYYWDENLLNWIKPGEIEFIAVTHLPCSECIKAISQKEIKRVIYRGLLPNYNNELTLTLAKEFGIEMVQI